MKRWGVFVLCMLGVVSCAPASEPDPVLSEFNQVDLVVYTAQEADVYAPLVKEFEERTNLNVKVEAGSSEQLQYSLKKAMEEGTGEDLPWDVVFGVGVEILEPVGACLMPYESPEIDASAEMFRCEDNRWTGFSIQPLVIMYNINVVTYREVPEGWKSLLEPRWKGRVAFLNPEHSELYTTALVTAVNAGNGQQDYVEKLAENMDYQVIDSFSELNEGIVDGRYFMGVTTEKSAQALRQAGVDVDYIYPQEGTTAFLDGTAILNGCRHLDAAREFVDFTISEDTQRMLVSNLSRRAVRMDVPPLYGLPPIDRLPLLTMNQQNLSEQKIMILEQWKKLFSETGRGHTE